MENNALVLTTRHYFAGLQKRQLTHDQKLFEDRKESLPYGYNSVNPDFLRIALMVECGEFLQELKKIWGWWKLTQKDIDNAKALEEFADVLHFILIGINKSGYTTDRFVRGYVMGREQALGKSLEDRGDLYISSAADEVMNGNTYMKGVGFGKLAELCGWSTDDVVGAYISKNEVNKKRIEDKY